jgi:hypothetical protein
LYNLHWIRQASQFFLNEVVKVYLMPKNVEWVNKLTKLRWNWKKRGVWCEQSPKHAHKTLLKPTLICTTMIHDSVRGGEVPRGCLLPQSQLSSLPLFFIALNLLTQASLLSLYAWTHNQQSSFYKATLWRYLFTLNSDLRWIVLSLMGEELSWQILPNQHSDQHHAVII